MFKKAIATTLSCVLLAAVGCGDGSTPSDSEESGKPVPNPHSDKDPYSTAATISYSHATWMSKIPDRTPLLDMSIPGAMAPWDIGPYVVHQYYSWHQAMSVVTQLSAGLRAFDMPLALDSTQPTGLTAVGTGGSTAPGNYVKDTFTAISTFLVAQPTETVIVRIGYIADGSDSDAWTQKVNALLQGMWPAGQATRVWQPSSVEAVTHPTMGDVRGKLVVIRSSSAGSGVPIDFIGYGIDDFAFRGNILEDQHLTTVGNLYSAWQEIKSQLAVINNLHKTPDSGQDGITALSGSGGAYPYFVASGFDAWQGYPLSTGRTTSLPDIYPDFNRFTCTLPNGRGICSVYYTGLNFLLNDALLHIPSRSGDNNADMSQYKNLGIFFITFPGESLIKAIINTNSSIASPE